ncbi:hypothetical protein [Helicobacter sp. NHP22-001]|uniref:hypothetical protein n=1 Tax=Helicobacter sp. NHP22-001 TaxID=3040202 RepID=UPI002553D7E8|nr:hypothetical protein [Helicobacter sp. NHP22-001]
MLECVRFLGKCKELFDGVFKPLILAALVSRLSAYVAVGYAEGKQVPLRPMKLTVLSVQALASAKQKQQLLEKRIVQEAILATERVLKRLATYRALDIRSDQYDGFVGKCQKHVNVYFPISNASTELQSDYHVSFHWRF